MCTIRTVEDDVACYDATMAQVRTYPVGAAMRALSVAPDGAVWVLGEQVARISPPTG
jgi:streptogramin lyase